MIATTEIYFRSVGQEDPLTISNVAGESLRHREIKQLGKEAEEEKIQF